MAKFRTLCPACNAEIHVYSEWAGKEADCPSCQSRITVPAPHPNDVQLLPAKQAVICPRCGISQTIPYNGEKEIRRNCSKCGTSYLYSPGLTFRSAEELPPGANGDRRIACPFCGRHYTLKFVPVNGLIGCQDCMNIFAVPASAETKNAEEVPPAFRPAGMPVRPAAPAPVTAAPAAPAVPNPIRFFPADEAALAAAPAPRAAEKEPAEKHPRQPLPPESLTPLPAIPEPAANKNGEKTVLLVPPPVQPFSSAASPEDPVDLTPPPSSKLRAFLAKHFDASTAATLLGVLQLAGNILWMLCGGLLSALIFVISGLLLCATVVLIPFGIQLFKLAGLVLCPFGADVYRKQESDKVGCLTTGLNILWLFFGGGLVIAFGNFLLALFFFITVVGTPLALQYLKIGKLVLTPFGLEVRHAPGIKRLYLIAGIILLLLILFL